MVFFFTGSRQCCTYYLLIKKHAEMKTQRFTLSSVRIDLQYVKQSYNLHRELHNYFIFERKGILNILDGFSTREC